MNNDTSLPERYTADWLADFRAPIDEVLRPEIQVLDVGSGRTPAISVDDRPHGCVYVGLDVSRSELELAQAGAYDEIIVSDVMERVPELEGRFDLIVSWQVFEHIHSLDAAMENMRRYLKPGGRLVAHLSGKYSLFGVINSVVPRSFGVWAMEKLLRRQPDTVFPAFYDHCTYEELVGLLRSWREAKVTPRYRGGMYFSFLRPLHKLYLAYEDWCIRGQRRNLATHYLIDAVA